MLRATTEAVTPGNPGAQRPAQERAIVQDKGGRCPPLLQQAHGPGHCRVIAESLKDSP